MMVKWLLTFMVAIHELSMITLELMMTVNNVRSIDGP